MQLFSADPLDSGINVAPGMNIAPFLAIIFSVALKIGIPNTIK